MVRQEFGVGGDGVQIVEVKAAEFVRAVGAALEPEDVMPIAVLGQGAVDPVAAGAFQTVEQGPVIAHEGLGAIQADRDDKFACRHFLEIVLLVTDGNGKVVGGREVVASGVRPVVQFAEFTGQLSEQLESIEFIHGQPPWYR